MKILFTFIIFYTPIYKVEQISDSISSNRFLQSFKPNAESLYSISIPLSYIPNAESLKIRVLDENQNVIGEKILPLYGNIIKAIFSPPLELKREHIYYIEILSNLSVRAYTNRFDLYPHGSLLYPELPPPNGYDLVMEVEGINWVRENYFGIGAYFTWGFHPEKHPKLIKLAKKLNIPFERSYWMWEYVQRRRPDSFAFDSTDMIVDFAIDTLGAKEIACFFYTPEWASSYPEDPDQYIPYINPCGYEVVIPGEKLHRFFPPKNLFEGENEKIVLTSDGFIKEKGDFYGISFKGNKKGIFEIDESLNEHIKNIKIEYSLKGIEFLRENEKLKLMNSEIKNSNYGVYFDGKNLEIQNSKIYFSDTGIYILKGKGFIKETEVKENGVGILNKGDSEINIFKSYIMKNKIGIYIDENSTPRLKNGKNHICFNNLYNLYNNTIYDVEAQMNWWGTKNKDSISLLIYDFYDDSTKGKVYFEPIWFPKENISGVQGYEEIKGEFVKLKNTIFRNFAEIEIISFKDSKLLLKIYDVSGRKVKEIEENIKKGKNKFKISGLKKGVYFIEVNFNEKLKKFKIIKI